MWYRLHQTIMVLIPLLLIHYQQAPLSSKFFFAPPWPWGNQMPPHHHPVCVMTHCTIITSQCIGENEMIHYQPSSICSNTVCFLIMSPLEARIYCHVGEVKIDRRSSGKKKLEGRTIRAKLVTYTVYCPSCWIFWGTVQPLQRKKIPSNAVVTRGKQ